MCVRPFALSGHRRGDAGPGLAKMYRVAPDRAWRPAVGLSLNEGLGVRATTDIKQLSTRLAFEYSLLDKGFSESCAFQQTYRT